MIKEEISMFNSEILEPNGLIQETNFRHTEDLRVYLWILTHSKKEVGYEGERFLEKGQYIALLSNLREYLWFYSGHKSDRYSVSRIQRSIKRLEKKGWIQAEKMPRGYVFTVLQ
jgi:hypothetical protein